MSFKENEIRPKDLMELKIPALEHDIKYLQDKIPNFKTINCPACDSKNHLHWAEKMKFNFQKSISESSSESISKTISKIKKK